LFAASEDLDGDGTAEPIYVLATDARLVNGSGSVCDPVCKAVLVVGDLTLPIELNWEQSAYWSSIRESAAFAVVDVNTADSKKEILIRTHYRQEEDPGILNRFVSLIDGRLVTADIGSESYNGGGVTWAGDGQVNLQVSFCPEEEATYRMKAGVLSEIDRHLEPLPPHGCPACPFVYVLAGDQWMRQGEILRHQVGANEDRWQRLPIESNGQQILQVRISEEKEEVTHLDAVRLLTGDAVVLPLICTSLSNLPFYCQADGAYTLLVKGDDSLLTFALPANTREVFLEARGYYTYAPLFAEQ